MATLNPFDLLGDDAEDPSMLIAAAQLQKPAVPASAPKKGPAQAAQPAKPTAKLPEKPLPPAQAVRESKNEGQRGGGRGSSRGGFRGRGRGYIQDSGAGENTFGSSNGFSGDYKAREDGETGKFSERRGGYGGPRGGGGRRGGFSNGDTAEGERPRRVFDRRSGTGRGSDFKREGAGRGNWGTPTDEIAPETEEPVNEEQMIVDTEKQTEQVDNTGDTSKGTPAAEPLEEEPEEKEMTLDEYEKLLEEKRKALLAQKPEERKVNLDKEFQSMQLLSNKKNDDEIFIKLGQDSEKDKRKEAVEKAKKTKSINEFLKPAEGENYYRSGGRGRGRGRGRGGFVGNSSVQAPSIEDVGQFPSLGAK